MLDHLWCVFHVPPPDGGCVEVAVPLLPILVQQLFLKNNICRVGAGEERDDRGTTDESRITVYALPFSLSQTDRVHGLYISLFPL